MSAYGRETVSAQCLRPFVPAGESVSRRFLRQCLREQSLVKRASWRTRAGG